MARELQTAAPPTAPPLSRDKSAGGTPIAVFAGGGAAYKQKVDRRNHLLRRTFVWREQIWSWERLPPERFAAARPPMATVSLNLKHKNRVWACCVNCGYSRKLNLEALFEAGFGDTELWRLPLRCAACGYMGHRIAISEQDAGHHWTPAQAKRPPGNGQAL
jgi:hypothetical protein